MLSQHSFSLLKYRFGLWLFESVFLHQFAQLLQVAGEVGRGVNLTVH